MSSGLSMAGQGRPASQTDAVVGMLALKRAGRAWPRALSRGVARSSSSAGGVDRAALLKALAEAEGATAPGPKMLLRFTCTHSACDAADDRTSTKIISRQAYDEGVVLVHCDCIPGSPKLHLIADRLGWFGDKTDIEAVMREKGEAVVRGMIEEGSLQIPKGA